MRFAIEFMLYLDMDSQGLGKWTYLNHKLIPLVSSTRNDIIKVTKTLQKTKFFIKKLRCACVRHGFVRERLVDHLSVKTACYSSHCQVVRDVTRFDHVS